jgi:hypothetical protein
LQAAFGYSKTACTVCFVETARSDSLSVYFVYSDTRRRSITQPIARQTYPILHNALTKVLK